MSVCFLVAEYGAFGDSVHLNTRAIQDAIDARAKRVGGTPAEFRLVTGLDVFRVGNRACGNDFQSAHLAGTAEFFGTVTRTV